MEALLAQPHTVRRWHIPSVVDGILALGGQGSYCRALLLVSLPLTARMVQQVANPAQGPWIGGCRSFVKY